MEPGYGAERQPVRVDTQIAALAATQYGVFRRDQVIALGATRGLIQRRIDGGRWERLSIGVYRLAGSTPSWRQSLLVACFTWGDGTVVSHRSAGALRRFPGFDPVNVEISVPGRRNRKQSGVVHHPRSLPPIDLTVVDGIPVTTVARTLIDLAAIMPADAIEEVLDDALRRNLVSIARVRWRLQESGSRGRAGTRALQAFLDARTGGLSVPQSVFETRFLRLVLDAGIPPPVVQHPVRRDGQVVAIVDFAYPNVRLAIETDGHRYHSGRVDFDRDRARRNALTLLQWRVIHVTWTDLVSRPTHIVEVLRNALHQSM